MKIVCILAGGPLRTIVTGARRWTFEEPHYGGPFIVGKRGDVLANQPGARSPFWRAFELWVAQGRAIGGDGLCVWSEPPPERWLSIRGTRHCIADTAEHREKYAGLFDVIDVPVSIEEVRRAHITEVQS